jgi:hypothetical protein
VPSLLSLPECVICEARPFCRRYFREEIFYREDFVYLYDELFTPGKRPSRSWAARRAILLLSFLLLLGQALRRLVQHRAVPVVCQAEQSLVGDHRDVELGGSSIYSIPSLAAGSCPAFDCLGK